MHSSQRLIVTQNAKAPPRGETEHSLAKKTEQERGSRFVFSLSRRVSGSLCFVPGRVKYQRPWPRDLLPLPENDRSHYKIKVTKIAHNASEKCKTISRSLS